MMNNDNTPPVPTSTPSIPTSTPSIPTSTPLDKLSYKELQVLAMSLNLPGKMKQGVLVEAIRARQNHNENVVNMILEANRQRKMMKHQTQHQAQRQANQQQQLMRLNIERAPQVQQHCVPNVPNVNIGSSRRKSAFPRPRMSLKRPASEMDAEYANDENMKRSKLAAALMQHRRPALYNSGAFNQQQRNVSCATWDPADQQSIAMATQLPMANRPLPELKDLSMLPVLNDCSITATPPSSDEPCGSMSNTWANLPNNPDQTVMSSTFDNDSGWVSSSADESYDSNNWRNMPKINNLNSNLNFSGNYQNSSNMSNQSNYYEDQSNMFNNSNNSDEFVTSTPVTTFADFIPPPPCHVETYQKSSHRSNPVPLPIAVMTSRLWFDCYDANCYHKNAPLFRVQRPGNPGLLFVHSGRSFTLPTFCNTSPRIASFIQ